METWVPKSCGLPPRSFHFEPPPSICLRIYMILYMLFVSSFFSFSPVGFKGNRLFLFFLFFFSPVGFKGNRFHYWTYVARFKGFLHVGFPVFVLKGIYHYWISETNGWHGPMRLGPPQRLSGRYGCGCRAEGAESGGCCVGAVFFAGPKKLPLVGGTPGSCRRFLETPPNH